MLQIIKSLFCTLVVIFGSGLVAVRAEPTIWLSDLSGNLGTVDMATGDVNIIGNTGIAMTDIAFDANGKLYGVDFTNLYVIDRGTATATLIGPTGFTLNSLVFGVDGTLYSAIDQLYTIDVSTGAASPVGAGGYFSSGDLAFIGSDLYLTALDGATGKDFLYKIDKDTGSGTLIGDLGFLSVYGLVSTNNVDLLGVTADNKIISINLNTGAGSVLLDISGKGFGFIGGAAFEPGSADSGTGDSGTAGGAGGGGSAVNIVVLLNLALLLMLMRKKT